ncbi:MAG TPA: hypothetical protein VHB97_24345 [Polyangia bacterium]|nr:hypothetical protein [Polyangia bacterium]
MTRAAWLLAGALAAGCVAPQPPAEPDLARPAAARPTVAAPPPLPALAEVEIGGTIALPPHAKGDVTVWAVDAPCWQPGARAFGTTKATGDKFFFEVMVPQGSQIWICAAVGDGKKPLEIYGQATRAPLLGKGAGEVPFMGIAVPLAKGKKVAAPGTR